MSLESEKTEIFLTDKRSIKLYCQLRKMLIFSEIRMLQYIRLSKTKWGGNTIALPPDYVTVAETKSS